MGFSTMHLRLAYLPVRFIFAVIEPLGSPTLTRIGSEEGVIFQASRNGGVGEEFQGHAGPITVSAAVLMMS